MEVLEDMRTPSWVLIMARSIPRDSHLSRQNSTVSLTSVLLFQHLQEVSHRVGYWLQSEHAELIPAWEGDGDVRQTIHDVDVIDLLEVGDGRGGGARVSGAELGLVEGGNQPGAVEGGEMFGQHSVLSCPETKHSLYSPLLRGYQRILTVIVAVKSRRF